jgi:hypothetical protein
MAFLAAHGAGALLAVLVAQRIGLSAADVGPVLAGWALLHLALHRELEAARPRHPWTIASGLAAWALLLVSVAFVFPASSGAIAVSTLLLDAAFFLLVRFPGTTRVRGLLSAAGCAASAFAVLLAAREGGDLLPRTLLVVTLLLLRHFVLSRGLAGRIRDRLALAAILPAVHTFAVAALLAAAVARREGPPAALACVVVGVLYLVMSRTATRAGLVPAAAFAFAEALALLGLHYGVAVAEYYLCALALFLYVVLPTRGGAGASSAGGRWLLDGRRGVASQAQSHFLPALILAFTVGYAAWALVRTHDEVHLFYLGATAAALVFAFARAGQAAAYT